MGNSTFSNDKCRDVPSAPPPLLRTAHVRSSALPLPEAVGRVGTRIQNHPGQLQKSPGKLSASNGVLPTRRAVHLEVQEDSREGQHPVQVSFLWTRAFLDRDETELRDGTLKG